MNPFQWNNEWNNEVVDTMRSTMEKTTNTLIAMQGTWDTVLDAVNQQNLTNQKQGQDVYNDWMGIMRKSQERYRKFLESSLDMCISGFRHPGKETRV